MAAQPLFDLSTMDLNEVAVPPDVVAGINPQSGPMRQLDHLIWLNPTPKDYWEHSYSIDLVRQLVEDRMFPLTVKGLEEAMALLAK